MRKRSLIRRRRTVRWPDSKPFWRNTLWRAAVLAASLLALTLFRLSEDIGPDLAPEGRFQVARILDGDTVELLGGERLRLLYLDTPEKGEPFFDSATALLENLALGARAELEFGRRRRDGYGRLLASLYCDSIDVAVELLNRGYAYVYLFADNLGDPEQNERVRRALAAQRGAVDAGRGIWSLTRTPEAHYVTTRRSLRFHRPACGSVVNRSPGELRVFEDFREALYEGLSPCRNCRP